MLRTLKKFPISAQSYLQPLFGKRFVFIMCSSQHRLFLLTSMRPEDLFQRLQSFMEDTLLRSDGSIRHHGDLPDSDEDLSPSLAYMVKIDKPWSTSLSQTTLVDRTKITNSRYQQAWNFTSFRLILSWLFCTKATYITLDMCSWRGDCL